MSKKVVGRKRETKESTSKKQKKIKEFIILDNNNINNNINKNIEDNLTILSSDDDYSDEFISNTKISMFTETNDDEKSIELTYDTINKLSMFTD